MESATVYLKTCLYTLKGTDAHIPAGSTVLGGTITEKGGGHITLHTTKFISAAGKALEGSEATLILPLAKIDHIHLS